MGTGRRIRLTRIADASLCGRRMVMGHPRGRAAARIVGVRASGAE